MIMARDGMMDWRQPMMECGIVPCEYIFTLKKHCRCTILHTSSHIILEQGSVHIESISSLPHNKHIDLRTSHVYIETPIFFGEESHC
mmetsp:Transcript_30056/g.55235  ORF Transcript_30056/g.55235 Transcript_30056/m.55235 type:complete len:87 (-) Transcript_30056:200-460(-)